MCWCEAVTCADVTVYVYDMSMLTPGLRWSLSAVAISCSEIRTSDGIIRTMQHTLQGLPCSLANHDSMHVCGLHHQI